MSFLSTLLKKRVKMGTQPVNAYIPGDLFDPGAERFAYETTVADPTYITRVFPQWNFTPLSVTQPEMNFQFLALPQDPYQGFPYGGMQPTGLIDPSEYPDVTGGYYQ